MSPRRTRARTVLRFAAAFSVAIAAVAALGSCQKVIGDGCGTDTDCSLNYDRRCDITMQGGYCTIPECDPDRCPGEALCVEFNGSSNDSRLARRFCMSPCTTDGDCRGGYVCLPPTTPRTEPCPVDTGTGQFAVCTRVLDTVTGPGTVRPRTNYCVQTATIPR